VLIGYPPPHQPFTVVNGKNPVRPRPLQVMDVRRNVERNLRRLRLERALTQEAFAHDARIAPSFLSPIETGQRSPTVTLLQRLATALRVPIVEFFSEAKPAPTKGLPRGRRTRK
jgi:DNA-binding XRE family transcriptional regulator